VRAWLHEAIIPIDDPTAADDAVGGSFGHAERGRDVAQSHPGVVGDAPQNRAWW
jgi:hypothetical protein